MNRTQSRTKWQDVLGFDDGSLPSNSSTYGSTAYGTASTSNLSTQYNEEVYPDFPRAMNIVYHPNPARQDLLIRAYLPPPKYGPEDKEAGGWLPKIVPLFYITVREDVLPWIRTSGRFRPYDEIQTSRPELLLHEGSRASKRVLAQAKFHAVTMCTDITLTPSSHRVPSMRALSRSESRGYVVGRPATSPSESGFEKPLMVLGKEDSPRPRLKVARTCLKGGNGFFRPGKWGFEIVKDENRERYEWKKDRTGEKREKWCGMGVGEGARHCQKLKLLNARSNETVATFVRSDDDEGLGLFRFHGDQMEGEFDVLALMSLLSVVERGRRKGSNRLSKAFRNE